MTTICPGCKDRPIAEGHYMCLQCEDRMAGRPPRGPRPESTKSKQGASSPSTPFLIGRSPAEKWLPPPKVILWTGFFRYERVINRKSTWVR